MTERKTNWLNFRSLIFFVLTCGLLVSAVSAAVPVADFTVLPAIGDTPLTSAFTDTSINVPDTWNWSFGDGTPWVNGTTVAEQNPSHIYTVTGVYTVTMICNNTDGSDTETKAGVIVVLPVASFAYTPSSGTIPLTVAFTDASLGPPDTWNWSFGDGSAWVNGTTVAEQNPSHTYTFPGAYTITLICNSTAGSDTKTGVSVSASSVAIPGGITSVLAAFAIAGVGLIVAGVVIIIRSLQGVMGYQSRYSSSTGGELVAGIAAILIGAAILIVGYALLSPLFNILGLGI
jgi:PKD repeat protein